jgi:signal transduction histidine kinase
MLYKNKQLYHQMVSTALNEQKVKSLNREISLRSQVAERNARLEERENIARNIHNVVGHTITSALVSLQAYEVLKEADPNRAEGKLSATSERMHLALEEIRRAVRVLDAETEDISLQDFCSLLATEADKFSTDTEIKIVHNFAESHDKELRVEKRTCEFLHSVLTECLNNGIRHGGATQFFVHLTYDTSHIRLVVSDDGKGFEGLSVVEQKKRLENGYGLRKMKDYVQTHAGTFKVDGEDGFQVQVELPLVVAAEEKGEQ